MSRPSVCANCQQRQYTWYGTTAPDGPGCNHHVYDDSCSKQSYYDLIFDLVVNTCTIQLNRTYTYIFYKSNTKSTCNEDMNQRKILHQNNNSTFRASMQMGHLDVQTTAISTSQFHKPKGQQDAGIMANKYTVC
jgi:hypothetical protein